MPRRILIPLLITTTLIAAAVLLPRTQMVRSWLLSRATAIVGGLGYELTFDKHAGNPWTGVVLEGVALVGPGLDVELARLDIGYFLPSLLTGELPLSLAVETVRGKVDVDGFDRASGGGGGPLRLRLRDLALDDIAIAIDDAPFTLPDLGLEGLSADAQRPGEGIAVAGTVVSSEGRAPFAGTLTMAPFGVDVAVTAADLTLARHWWTGVQAGQLDADVVYGDQGLLVDGTIRGGAVELIGTSFRDLEGPVSFRGLEIEANLDGRGLAGPVAVDGTVDIASRRWRANYRAAPDVGAAAAWLSPGLAGTLADLGVTAEIEVVGEVGGWREVSSSGEVMLTGSFLGRAIEDGEARYSFSSADGVQVAGSARWAGGSLTAGLEPVEGGFDLSAQANGVALDVGGFEVTADGSIVYSRRPDRTSATYLATLGSEVFGRAVRLMLDGGLDDDGWQAFVSGSDDLGATLEGAVVLAGDHVQSGFTVEALHLPQLPEALSFTVNAAGNFDALDIEGALLAPDELRLERGLVAASIDPRGDFGGTLSGSRVGDLRLALGPLAVTGSADWAEGEVDVEYRLAPTPITLSEVAGNSGDVVVTLAVTEGSFGWSEDRFEHRARVATGPLALGPVASEALVGDLVQSSGQAWTFEGEDVAATLSPGLERLALTFDGFPLTVAGRTVRVDGEAAADLAAPVASLEADLGLTTGDVKVAARSAAGRLSLTSRLPATMFPVELAQPVDLAGELDLANLATRLRAQAGEVRLDLSGTLGGEPLQGTLLSAGREAMVTVDPNGLAWSLRGDLGLEALAVIGIEAAGTLSGELSGSGASVLGGLAGDIAEPLPARVELRADGQTVTLQGATSLAGIDIGVSGRAWPDTALRADIAEYGTVELSGGLLRGAGELPGVELGPLSVAGQPWQLSGSLVPAEATVTAGTSTVRGRLDGGWALTATIDQIVDLAGEPLQLAFEAGLAQDRPEGSIEGTATLLSHGDSVSFSGSLDTITVAGSLAAAVATELAGIDAVTPAGQVTLSGMVAPLDGPSYTLTGRWSGTGFDVALDALGRGGTVELTARGDGIDARFGENGVEATLSNVDLAGFLLDPEIAATATGTLGLDGALWSGDMTLLLRRPLLAEVRLRGVDGALTAQASFDDPLVRAELQGQVLPELGLQIDASLLGDRAHLVARASGPLGDPTIGGTLTTEPQAFLELIDVPALEAEVDFDPSGLGVIISGDGIDVRGNLGALAGTIDLGVRIAGRPHLFAIEVAGTPQAPSGWLQISGPLAEGSVLYDGDVATIDLRASPELLPLAEDTGIELGRVTVVGTADAAGRWQGVITSPVAYLGLRTAVRADASGELLDYRGEIRIETTEVNPGATLAAATVRGSGAAAEIDLDLETVDVDVLAVLFGLPLAGGEATGSLHLATEPFDARIDARLVGKAGGVPFDLTAAAQAGGPIDLAVNALGFEVHATGSTERAELTVSGRGVDVSGEIGFGSIVRLDVTGSLADLPLRAELAYDPDTETGSLSGNALGVAVNTTLTGPLGALLVSGTAATDGVPAIGGGASAEFTLRRDGPTIAVGLGAQLRDAAVPATLRLDGELLPNPALRGDIDLGPPYGTLAIEVGTATSGAGYAIRAIREDLHTEVTLAADLSLVEAALAGRGVLPVAGRTLEIDRAELSWRPDSGFAGLVELAATEFGIDGEATVTGLGGLEVELRLQRGGPLIEGSVQLSSRPWSDRSLTGALSYRIDPAQFTDVSLPDGVALIGEVAVAGSWSDPSLEAEATLKGPVGALGGWSYRGGAGTLTLTGDGFGLDAAADAGGWQAHLDVADYPLAETLPWLTEPHVRAQGELSGSWSGPLRAVLPELMLTSGASELAGQATLQFGSGPTSFAAVARLDVELSDLQIGTPLRGRVRGPIAISGDGNDLSTGNLSGLLALTRLGPQGALETASLGGTLQLSGQVADPLLTLHLEGEGEAGGSLRGTVRPLALEAALESDLRFDPLTTDLSLTLSGAGVSASGTLSYGDLSASVAPDGDRLLLLGEGRLAGVRGTIDPGARRARLEAPLATLSNILSGEATVELALPTAAETEPWLSGTVADAQVSGIELGDLEIVSHELGGEIAVSGKIVRARLDPGSGMIWSADLGAVVLAPGLTLTASGKGAGLQGQIGGVLDGDIGGRPLRLPLEISVGEAAVLSVEGEALGGTVSIRARLDEASGWSGTVALADVELGPETISLSGRLAGPRAAPRLELDADIAGTVAGSARIAAALDGVRVEASAETGVLDERVEITGELWPTVAISLGLEGRPGTLRVTAAAPGVDAPLHLAGELATTIGPVAVTLRGDEGALVAELRAGGAVDLPGLVLTSVPLTGSVTEIVAGLRSGGLDFLGSEATAGTVTLRLDPAGVAVDDVRYDGTNFTLQLSGDAGLRSPTRLEGRLDLSEVGAAVPGLPDETSLPFVLSGEGDLWSVLVEGERGRLEAAADIAERSGRLQGNLSIGNGSITADLSLAPQTATGRLDLAGVRLTGVPGLSGFELSGRIDALGDQLVGTLDLDDLAGRGGADITGNYPLADLFAGTPSLDTLTANARIRTFNLASLSPVAARLPNLSGAVSGVAQLRRGQLVGRLVAPDLAVLDTGLPTEIEFNGTIDRLDVRANVAGSPLTGQVSTEAVSALLRLERFPLQVLVEAVAGATDISAEMTGVARLLLPLSAPDEIEVRVATELIRLERDGVVTVGNAIFDYHDNALTVQDVAFEGVGSWEASGVVRSDRLDLRVTADGADFAPLLGLVPALAQLEVGAKGNFSLVAGGSLTRPTVALDSDELTFSLAGSTYRLEGAAVNLDGSSLRARAKLVGISPIVGSLSVQGSGMLSLAPLRLAEAAFEIDGSATVPILGEVSELVGSVTAAGGEPPRLQATGRVGNAFTLDGTLIPLDLRLRGDALAIRAPNLLLASSVMDVDVTVRYTDALDIGGTLLADEVRFQLGIRPRAVEGGGTSSRSALDRVRFAGLQIEAPGRIFFSESFASLEARASLELSGTAATPRLSGTASALRGSIRFSGRDFTIEQGVATFEPARGPYPLIDLAAVTSFDKARVIPAGAQVRFVEPRSGARFEVELRFQGAVEPRAGGGFSLDFDPELSSDARIEVEGEAALTSGPRLLTPSELLALVTLGRLDISSILAGDGGLVTAVAQGALDTAVDLLVLAELQAALSEALGVEVVEIRTTALSSLLDGARGDPFGVSLRLGGYLTEELFASFQIGSFDDANAEFALTNEVRLTYALGPVEFDLAGGVNFAANEDLAPIPELSTSVRYGLTPLFGLEAGVDLSSTRSQIRFGVTVRY